MTNKINPHDLINDMIGRIPAKNLTPKDMDNLNSIDIYITELENIAKALTNGLDESEEAMTPFDSKHIQITIGDMHIYNIQSDKIE